MTMTNAAIARGLATTLDDAFLYMNGVEMQPDKPPLGVSVSPRFFDNAFPFTIEEALHGYDDSVWVGADMWPGVLGRPLDQTLIHRDADNPGNFGVTRYRRVSRTHGRACGFARHVIESTTLMVDRSTCVGRVHRCYIGANSGELGSYLFLSGRRPTRAPAQSEYGVRLACGLQFAEDWYWHVSLRWLDAPIGVRFVTTPAGARALFRLREVPEGAKRRAALRHWVSEHTRRHRRPDGSADLTWVREHLRGAIPFRWNDMEGLIQPSADDLRRLEDR